MENFEKIPTIKNVEDVIISESTMVKNLKDLEDEEKHLKHTIQSLKEELNLAESKNSTESAAINGKLRAYERILDEVMATIAIKSREASNNHSDFDSALKGTGEEAEAARLSARKNN